MKFDFVVDHSTLLTPSQKQRFKRAKEGKRADRIWVQNVFEVFSMRSGLHMSAGIQLFKLGDLSHARHLFARMALKEPRTIMTPAGKITNPKREHLEGLGNMDVTDCITMMTKHFDDALTVSHPGFIYHDQHKAERIVNQKGMQASNKKLVAKVTAGIKKDPKALKVEKRKILKGTT